MLRVCQLVPMSMLTISLTSVHHPNLRPLPNGPIHSLRIPHLRPLLREPPSPPDVRQDSHRTLLVRWVRCVLFFLLAFSFSESENSPSAVGGAVQFFYAWRIWTLARWAVHKPSLVVLVIVIVLVRTPL